MKFPAMIALFLAIALPAFAQGPGGGGGFNPGGGGSSGTFTYDSIQSNVTNADATVSRNGLLFARSDSPVAIAPPSSITAIADGLFAGCTTLVTADLSSTAITALPSDCFAGCTALTTVVLPDTCTSIGPNAFAGCTALASVTAPAVASVASDAFRDCTSLAALPSFASGAALGPYAFADSGLLSVDAENLVLGSGAFSGCLSLAALSNAPVDLPDALCSGCTSLAFDPYPCYSIGQAALAGVPYGTISLESDTRLSPYAFAASAATVDTLLDCSFPAKLAYDPTAFLGRTVSFQTGTAVARLEAAHLVEWLKLQRMSPVSTVTQPASYNTADLEQWIGNAANVDALYLYTSNPETSGPDLGVSGDAFLFAPPSAEATSVRVALESTSDLLDPDSWTADALDLDPATSTDALLAYTSTNALSFARLAFYPAW